MISSIISENPFVLISGAFFIFSGVSKVLYSNVFVIHLERLGMLSKKLNAVFAMTLIQIECAIGCALLLRVYVEEITYLAGIMVVGLTLVTIWGAIGKKITDCGCYGIVVSVSPLKSVLINLSVMIVLGLSLVTAREIGGTVPMWKTLSVIAVIVASNALAKLSLRKPLIDLTPLRPGKTWKSDWLNLKEEKESQRILLLFLDTSCGRCEKWMSTLILDTNNPLAVNQVRYIYPSDKAEVVTKKQYPLPLSSLHYLPVPIYRKLVYLAPTAVLVDQGIIREKWVNHLPPEYTV